MPTFSPNTALDPLDRIAIAILHDCGESMEQQGKTLKTGNHDLRCVAVADIAGTLLIAANNALVTKDVMTSRRNGRDALPQWKRVRKSINKGDPIADARADLIDLQSELNEIAANSGSYAGAIFVTGIHTYFNNYHAEMQLLQFMLDYHVRPRRRYIGVSKPCCPECTAILLEAKFSFAESHPLNAKAVRNAAAAFAHPHLRLHDLATEFAGGERALPRSLKGAYLAPF